MSDTNTRSGMLWEVERILYECKELGTLPQILIMENVVQIHGKKNIEDFQRWQNSLKELGYSNYYQDLIATDYGIPQTRNRCFMVSILGDYSYTFPKPIPLKLKLKDMLEDNVDEKYYLSDSMIKYISADNEKWTGNNDKALINKTYASTLNTNEGSRRCDASNYISNEVEENYNLKSKKVIRKYGLFDKGKVKHQAGSIYDKNGLAPTLDTATGGYRQPMIEESIYSETEKKLFTEDGNIKRYINSDVIDKFEEGQMATTSYPNGWGHGPRTHNNSIALNTVDKPSVKQNLRIRKLTPRECGRLMNVSNDDITKILSHQSNSSAFHLFGDSICTNVLMAIIGELLDVDWQQKIEEMLKIYE